MTSLAVVILTYNEERHIGRAIGSVRGIAREVFVIDSHSRDRTVDIARAAGATVLEHPFENYARQFQWGLDNAPITADWVMRLDADEVIEDDLACEIARRLPTLPAAVTGVNLKRKHFFLGRWIRHGGRYPLVLLRIWRRGVARIEDRWMDEHMVLSHGSTITFDGGFADHNLNDLTFFTQKHNQYATREAIDVLNQKYGLFPRETIESQSSNSWQAFIKRLIKERIYNRIPFYVAAPGYFLFRYVFQLGFLDGAPGMVYHFLQGCWYRFLVGAKTKEFELALALVEGKQAKLATLSALTGYRLETADTPKH